MLMKNGSSRNKDIEEEIGSVLNVSNTFNDAIVSLLKHFFADIMNFSFLPLVLCTV